MKEMWTFSKKKKQYPVKLGGRKRPLVLNVDLAADLDLDLAAGLKEAQPCPTAHILKHPLLYSSHKYVWNIFETDRYYIYDHILAQQEGSERIFGGEILVVFSQIWNWPNIIVINYSHKWRHPGIFIICSIVTQMNCFVQLMCYLFCQKIGMEKKSCKFSTVLQVCGRIWGPSRIEINVSTAGKLPQFSENAILWSLNARTHTHCVWKF